VVGRAREVRMEVRADSRALGPLPEGEEEEGVGAMLAARGEDTPIDLGESREAAKQQTLREWSESTVALPYALRE
jgi:hypothetical protein